MTIDLNKFCGGENEIHSYLRQPFRHNGQIIATNGHIIISIQDDGREASTPTKELTDLVDKIFTRTMDTYAPVSGIYIPEAEKCKHCGNPDYQDEEGVCVCDDTGFVLHQNVLVGATTFARRYLALIAELPNAEIGVSVDEKLWQVPFRFDGGQGYVMPMRVR